jgi:enoyl-CoA hydratase/methylglutaconyl-CoA hydratase
VTELVHLHVADGVATITLDSPANRNALSSQLVAELFDRLAAADADDSVRALLLTAAGSTFCAGADLSEAGSGGMQEGTRALLSLLRTIVCLPKPVVAQVRGHVRAGGIGLVGACDLAVVADSSSYAFTEVRLGLSPAIISLTTLPHLDSRAGARYFLTGEKFDGAEAARIGLVTTAVLEPELDVVVASVLDGLRAGAPQGLAATKELTTRAVRAQLDEYGEQMVDLSARLFGSDEAREAMQAFLARRR